jgi:hypothetical protein
MSLRRFIVPKNGSKKGRYQDRPKANDTPTRKDWSVQPHDNNR